VNVNGEANHVEPSEVNSKLKVMSVGNGVITDWAARVIAGSVEVDVMRVTNVEPSEVTSELVVMIVGGGVVTDWTATACCGVGVDVTFGQLRAQPRITQKTNRFVSTFVVRHWSHPPRDFNARNGGSNPHSSFVLELVVVVDAC